MCPHCHPPHLIIVSNIMINILIIIFVIMIVGFSLMSVADVLIHSGALLFLGRLRKCDDDDDDNIDDGDNVGAGGHLTVLFWDRATHWVGDDNTSTLLESC